jgi:uncharacterized protein (DUF934 family)
MAAVIGWLYRMGLRKGAAGGSPAWWIVALAAFILRRDRERRRESALTVPVKPGESVIVTMRDLGSSADS